MGFRTVAVRRDPVTWAGWLAFLAGFGIVGYGLSRHLGRMQSEWQPGSIAAIAIGFGLMVAWEAFGAWRRAPTSIWRLAGVLLLSSVAFGLAATLAVVLVLVSSYAWGGVVLGPSNDRDESPGLGCLLRIATGLGLLVSALYMCGRWQIHYVASYVALLALPVLFKPGSVSELARCWQAGRLAERPADQWSAALLWLGAGGLMIRFAATMAPEIGADALSMHLYIPIHVAERHAFVPQAVHLAWAWMPMAGDWLYTLAYMLGGEAASRLVNLATEVLVALLCHAGATAAFDRRAGAIAFALYACNPLGYLLTSSLFVDNPWTLWLLSACLLSWFSAGRPRWLLAAACCYGTALAAKAPTMFYAPLLFLAVFASPLHSSARMRAGVIAACVAVVLAVGMHPYLMAWRDTGNPMFPFLNQVFQSPLYPQADFTQGLPYKATVDWKFPYLATFDTSRYLEALPGSIGVAWLALLPLAVVSMGWRGWRWVVQLLLLALAGWLTLRQMAYLRYLSPAFPLLAIYLAGAPYSSRLSQTFRNWVAGGIIVVCAMGLMWFPNATWWYRTLLPVAWRDGGAAYGDWMRENRPERVLAARIEQHGLRRVLWLGDSAYAGFNGRLFVDSWYQPETQGQLSRISTVDEAVAWLSAHRIEGVVYASGEVPCKSNWTCGLLHRLDAPVDAVGDARLYRIPADIAYPEEILRDPSMDDVQAHWAAPASRPSVAGGLVASVENPAAQSVDVIPGSEYRLEMQATCDAPHGAYRLQVNWLDGSGALLRPDIDVRPCNPGPDRGSRVLVAPARARKAIVYASGHSPGQQVVFTEASLRRRDPGAASGAGLWHELLRDTSFDGGGAWIGTGVRAAQGGGLLVDRLHYSSQSVAVRGGEQYLYSVTARCTSPGGRVKHQVNWQDASNFLIRADVMTTPCEAAYSESERLLRAPSSAAMAIVYAAGDSDVPVEVGDASFRNRGAPRWPFPWK